MLLIFLSNVTNGYEWLQVVTNLCNHANPVIKPFFKVGYKVTTFKKLSLYVKEFLMYLLLSFIYVFTF